MPYTAGTADLTIGPRIAAQGIQSSMSSLTDILARIGMQYQQDKVAGAQLDAFKSAGYFDPQPGQGPESAMMPAALYSAAQKGPLGTKMAMAGVLQNYLQMNYQMKMAQRKYMMEQGGAMPGTGQGGQQGGQQAQPAQPAQPKQAFDLNTPPAPPSGPWNSKDSE